MFKRKYKAIVLAFGVVIALLIYGNITVLMPKADVKVALEQPQHGHLILFTDVVELTAKHLLFLKEKSN